MILAMLLLALADDPSIPTPAVLGNSDEQLVQTVIKLDETREVLMMRDATGKPVRAIVRRIDGKPMMTCDPYWAWVSHDFHCGQGCGNPYTANGSAGGASRANACLNARNDGCSQTACSPPSAYVYCGFIAAFAGQYYDANPGCGYEFLHDCLVDDDCS